MKQKPKRHQHILNLCTGQQQHIARLTNSTRLICYHFNRFVPQTPLRFIHTNATFYTFQCNAAYKTKIHTTHTGIKTAPTQHTPNIIASSTFITTATKQTKPMRHTHTHPNHLACINANSLRSIYYIPIRPIQKHHATNTHTHTHTHIYIYIYTCTHMHLYISYIHTTPTY